MTSQPLAASTPWKARSSTRVSLPHTTKSSQSPLEKPPSSPSSHHHLLFCSCAITKQTKRLKLSSSSYSSLFVLYFCLSTKSRTPHFSVPPFQATLFLTTHFIFSLHMPKVQCFLVFHALIASQLLLFFLIPICS